MIRNFDVKAKVHAINSVRRWVVLGGWGTVSMEKVGTEDADGTIIEISKIWASIMERGHKKKGVIIKMSRAKVTGWGHHFVKT